jgi:two-component system, OmpR family, sensor kinase
MTVRRRLLLIVLLALAAALALSTLGFNLIFAHTTLRSADSLLRARASSEVELLSLPHGKLVAPEATDGLGESRTWIFDGTRAIEHPRARSAADAVAQALAGGPRRFVDVSGTDIRLYAEPVVIGGRHVGTAVAGLSLAPYEQAEENALLGSLALAVVMLAAVGLAVWWLLRSALRPVAQMTEQAAVWSERDLDRRFELGPARDELTQLAATLDALLDRLAASLRHERRFSAELSHELRTPLARVIAEAEVTLMRERDAPEYRAALQRALRSARQVERIVVALVTAAQQEAGAARGTSDAYAVAVDAADAVASLADERRVALVAEEPARPIRLGVDGQLAERVLQPILENACRYGRSTARVRIARQGSKVLYVVEDDGPGVRPEETELIFEPGVRGNNGVGSEGAGLGLALARRLARTASGDVTVDGRTFVVSLPAA